jgi:pantoate--beta-alanine ligase
MTVISSVEKLQKVIKDESLYPLGFVPTMGALHEGHLSLVKNATDMCPLVVVSIYVNPTQFNDKEDLRRYPRTPDEDKELLGRVLREHDIIFTPDDREMYPEKITREYNFGNLDKVMEAKHRPGHFNGVAMVVSRFFEIIRPDYAFFGQKDFQQLAVIKELVRQTGDMVKIIGNPIIREKDGLAMSSRNKLLSPGIRENAGIIFRTLSSASKMLRDHDIPEIKQFVVETIDKIPGFRVEYFEIADDAELLTVNSVQEIRKVRKYYGCIAVKAGSVRLIDNTEFPL